MINKSSILIYQLAFKFIITYSFILCQQIILKQSRMETPFPIKEKSMAFKKQSYEILLTPVSQKQISLQIIDPIGRIQYSDDDITLNSIGYKTLIKALKGSDKGITISIQNKHKGQQQAIELVVKVESLFLKAFSQSIFVKKVKEIKQSELIQMKLNLLNQKLKNLKLEENRLVPQTFYSTLVQQKNYSSGSGMYQPLASIKLKKGKYMLTFSFLLKAGGTWLYLYLNQGEQILANGGFYVPNGQSFIPYTVRKVYTVNQEEKQVVFNTYYTSSYYVTLRNCIITARKI